MKRFAALLTVLLSFSVNAQTLVCQEWGYSPTPEGFHSIKLEKVESTFYVSDDKVMKYPIGTTYSKVNPEDVGLADIQAETYKVGLELLYIYKDKGAIRVGVSHLVEDSDVYFGDKELFSECDYAKPKGGSQGVAASNSLFVVEGVPVHRAPEVYRF